MRMCNRTAALAAFAAVMLLGPVATGAGDVPPSYASATEAYRQGTKAMTAGAFADAVPALEYAAERGVLGAQLKLARLYANGRGVPRDDAKAFVYYRQIADQHAEITPLSPVAKYIGEAFVALGKYHVQGIPEIGLAASPARASNLFRHAASYFGNADAQYELARLYLDGTGVPKNVGLAVNWLSIAARKSHAPSQATLGELLWRGEQLPQRRSRGLALIAMAHASGVASGDEPSWINALYTEVVAGSNAATLAGAEALLKRMGKDSALLVVTPEQGGAPEMKSGAQILIPSAGTSPKPAAPLGAGTATASATEPALPVPNAAPGLGFAPGDPASHFKP